jgi:geranylgeranyl transferase type-1 subunit beta
LTDCIRWTVGRQTNHLEEDETETEEQTSQLAQPELVPMPSSPLGSPHATQFPAAALSPPKPLPAAGAQISKGATSNATEQDLRWAGFNGRPNKIADTCYCFWNTGALAVRTLSLSRRCSANRTKQLLRQLDLIDKLRMRRYLLEKTQHIVGGFGKGVGEAPGKAHRPC